MVSGKTPLTSCAQFRIFLQPNEWNGVASAMRKYLHN
jgi:hypothetical protein